MCGFCLTDWFMLIIWKLGCAFYSHKDNSTLNKYNRFVSSEVFFGAGKVYLLVLVGRDCGELRLREREGVHPLSRQRLDLGQVEPRVVADDVHARFVLVHGLQDDLGQKNDVANKSSTGK